MTTPAPITIDPTDYDSLRDAIRAGLTTPEQLAQWLGIDTEEGCLVLEPTLIVWLDDGTEVGRLDHDEDLDSDLEEIARECFGDRRTTQFVAFATCRMGIDKKGECQGVGMEYHSVIIHPDEPPCEEIARECYGDGHYSHEWVIEREPWGCGGGITYSERCVHCGVVKECCTWATNPNDGTQGDETVEYVFPDDDE